MLHRSELGKDLLGRAPVKWSHREMIVGTLANSQLILKVLERIETMRSVELFVVFSVASLHFSVVPWCVGLDQLVPNTKTFQLGFKGRRSIAALGQQSLCKFGAVIGLYTFNRVRKSFHYVLKEQFR